MELPAGSNRKLDGSTIKIIAMVSMLIDHIGASVMEKDSQKAIQFLGKRLFWILDFSLRGIGRIAFPLFIFLLLEGFKHTRNRKKYALRLLILAFISEIPYDLAFRINKKQLMEGKVFETTDQNVFFTLFIGLTAISLIDIVRKKLENNQRAFIEILIIVASIGLAYFLAVDYDIAGVCAILAGYFFINDTKGEMLAICVVLIAMDLFELPALIGIILVNRYSGRRGLDMKWPFYAFYPVHLAVLAIITLMIY